MCANHRKHKAAAADSCCNGIAKPKPSDKLDTRLRNFMIRTNIDLFIIGLAVAIYQVPALLVHAAETEHGSTAVHESTAEHGTHETEIRSTEYVPVVCTISWCLCLLRPQPICPRFTLYRGNVHHRFTYRLYRVSY